MKQVFFIVCTLIFVACNSEKTTICFGKVVDGVTQEPIEGFVVYLVGDPIASPSDTTDVDGNFYLEILAKRRDKIWMMGVNWPPTNEQEALFFYDSQLGKDLLKIGKSNEKNLEIGKKDAFIRMHIHNISASKGKIHGHITSSTAEKYQGHGEYFYYADQPLLIPEGDSLTFTMRTAGDVESTIFLDSLYILDMKTPDGKIICPRYDTTDIWIKY